MVGVATHSHSPSLPSSSSHRGAGLRVRSSRPEPVLQFLLSCPVLGAAPSCLPLVLSEDHLLCSPWCERGREASGSEKRRLRVSPEGLDQSFFFPGGWGQGFLPQQEGPLGL